MAEETDRTVFDMIMAGEVPAEILYEDEDAVAFTDINPQAPVHFLVIPRRRINSLARMTDGDSDLIGRVLRVCSIVAAQHGLADDGYRVVTNIGRAGGQTVDHIHFHVLGGRSMSWPPG